MENLDARALIIEYIAAYNAFDLERMLAVLAPGVRFEHYAGGELTAQAQGIAEFRALAEEASDVFAERQQSVTRWDSADSGTGISVDSGTGISVDIAYRGKLARAIPGGPPAGTVLELAGVSEFGFADGKISRIVDRS